MTNFDTARDALETSLNSEGSAITEHEKWMQSLEAGINEVKAAWQSLSQSFLGSDFLRGLLDGVSSLTDGLGKLFDTFGTLPTLITAVMGGISLFKGGGFFKVITDEATGAAKGITTIFGQAAASVNHSLSTLNFNNGFRNTLNQNDIAAIQKYSMAVRQGVTDTTTLNRCMDGASNAARAYVQNTNAASVSVKGFENSQQAAGVATLAQSRSLSSASVLMKEYHSGCKTTGMSQADFANAVKQTNPQLAAAMTSTNGAKSGMVSYTLSLIGAKVATLALKVAATALNMALTMGISLIVTELFSAIQSWINSEEELAEKVEEVTSKFKQQHEELKKLKGDYDTSNESSMISKYEKLSKGVDNLGRNVSLTSEEYSEYQSIVNQIAEQIPSLVSGYDSQGNAILSCKGNVEELTNAYEKLIHAQNQSILIQNSSDIEENWKNVSEQASGYDFWETTGNVLGFDGIFGGKTDDWDMKIYTAEWLSSLTSDMSADDIENQLYDKWFRKNEVVEALMNAGYGVSQWSDEENVAEWLEYILDKEPEKIKNIVDNFYAQFDDDVAQYKTKAAALLSEAFDVSSSISGLNYGNISEELQAIAYQVVNSLDFNFLNNLSESGVTIEEWVKNMLDQLNAIRDEDSASIESAFNLQTQFNGGEISYGEYVKSLEDTGKLIDSLGIDEEVKSHLKLSIGLDEDGLVAEYQQLKNRLADDELFDIMPSEYEPFLEGLSSEELSVLIDIIPELSETEYKETIDDVKSAIRREMILQGLTFDLNLEVESTGIEALNTALAESVSATGLSSESISALKSRYSELESQGYDLSSMFEETSNGIHLNRNELNKLEKAYASQKLDEVNSDLAEMKAEYDRLGEELKTCGDEAKAGIYNDRLTLAQKISEAATLASQYEGLTSAYNDWLAAEEAGQERDMYEKIIEGFENVDDEISRGWIDDGTIKFLELLTGQTDLAGKSGKQLKEIYDGLDDTIKNTTYSVRDFFTVDEDGNSTNTGVYNFLDAIGQLEEEKFGGKDVVKRDKDGNIIGFDFELAGGDEVVAEALGVSEELVQIMVRAADDAGFVVSLDGTYRQLADLQNEAKAAADYLHKIGKTDFEFDFNTTSVENLKTQLEEAHKILDDKKFWNKDGTFNFNADGATEAMQVVSTLQAKLDKLTQEQYGIGLTVEEEEFEEPLENLQEYGHTVQTLNQLKLNPKVNADKIEELEGNLEDIAKYFANLDGDLKVELGLDADDNWEDVKKKIENGEVEIPTVLDIQANMDKNIETLADLALLNSGLLSEDEEKVIKQKYKVEVETEVEDDSFVGRTSIGKSGKIGDPTTRKTNIKVIAETFGIDDVDDLSSKLGGLNDKTIQAIAEVVGRIDVDKLKSTIATLEPKKVEAIAEAIGKGDVDGLQSAINQLSPKQVQAIAEALGYRDVHELNGAIDNMDGKTVQAVAQALGLNDVNTLQSAVSNMEGNTVDAKVNTDGQSEKINTLQGQIDGITGKTVNVVVNTVKRVVETVASGGAKKAAQRTGANPDGSDVNGTANVNGTTGRAFKQGSWGTKNSGTALVGELGTEVLVRNGRYYTIGDNGAEFIKYKKGDIIFNHIQSKELFANGKVTSGGGRGKAFVEGTAFSNGIGGGLSISAAKKDKIDQKKAERAAKAAKAAEKSAKEAKKAAEESSKIVSSSGSGGGTDKVEGTSVGKDKDKKEFEETFDWIEIAISRIEREIDNLDRVANSTYKTWSDRNKALASEISTVSEEIELQKDAAVEYLKEANSVGLDESWAKKVRNGTLDISTLNESNASEELIEKIKNYQKWYELYLQCTDAAEELREEESKLYAQRFENVQSKYDSILQGYEHTESMLNEYISQAEAQGHIVSEKYYDALITNEKQNIAQLKNEQSELIDARDEAVASGTIAKYSEEWYNMCSEIDSVTQAIEEGTTSLIEYNNAIRDIDWQKFDLIQERISDITSESEFLIELMSNKDLFDDNGKLTEQGAATIGLHGQNYNTYMYQADDYGKEVANLDKQIAKDPYDQELINRRIELLELQRESILAAEGEKNAIKDLIEEGINLELDALQERIDLHNEELDSMKDLYDYQKNVEEQTKNIASLRKQLGAYEGFDNEESRAKIQELKVSLEEAEADLQETEYDKFISDQTVLLDTLYTEYETILNSRLDNIDLLLQGIIDGINAAAGEEGAIATALGSGGAIATAIVNAMGENGTIKTILNTEANNVGTTLSTAMNNIWSVGEGNAKSVLTKYGDGFQNQQTTTNATLNNIKTDVAAMVDDVDKDAQKKVAANKTTTSAKKNPTTNTSTTNKPSTDTNTNKSTGDGKAKVGDKVKFVSGKYYYDSQGKKPLGSKNLGKEVYITKINTAKWATHPYHISTGKKLGTGDLGWLKLNQLSGYATGKKKISNNEYAWTQENGQEYIIRPSDGAILTPVAKGDSVLNAAASGNIWSMANNPAEFIKDNLGLDAANIPNGANVNNNVTQHFENINFNMPNVHSYNELITEMQRDPKFEKLILAMTLDQVAGKSKLGKNKAIR